MGKFGSVVYPFTAIVAQEKMKKGLVWNAVNPSIGGILIRGEKGTAKSTAVRALAEVLPCIKVVEDCVFNCNPDAEIKLCDRCKEKIKNGEEIKVVHKKVPVVELPVAATEDKVVGTLDLEYAIKSGKCKFEPGIIAKANRGIVYIDEVNLLNDHIVDVMLDSASMGINVVERESMSYAHPAEFILVGTMNPEEGDLRPQLMDRFGLCVEVEGVGEPDERVKIIKRREEFDKNPVEFKNKWCFEEKKLREKIEKAREILPKVNISENMLELIADLCIRAFVSGHRADLVMEAAARTVAALNGRYEVIKDDVYEAAELVLFHRKNPQPESPENEEQQKNQDNEEEHKDQNHMNEDEEKDRNNNEKKHGKDEEKNENNQENNSEEEQENDDTSDEKQQNRASKIIDKVFSIGKPFQVKKITYEKDRVLRKGSGRRSSTKTPSRAGRYIRSTMERNNNDFALDATLRAAAPYQKSRCHKGVAIAIESSDIRNKVREKKIGNFLIFVVDASGSMGAQQRMVETKGAILSLLLDAYQKRDKIAMIAFKGETAEAILPPTNSVELAHKLLEQMPTGGRTPLSAGMEKAYEMAKTELFKEPNISPMMIIISDGKGNVSVTREKPLKEAEKIAENIREEERIKTLVIDVEKKNLISFHLAKELAKNLGAQYYKIDDLKSDTLVQAVRNNMGN
ncbi:putative cobaltochelatase [Clostridium sp. KNHs214]|uniref:putative cobaltochelatase n=1 Tax=Clostridium sp. KNHs214 TaxID=1540257 RepID=UPI00054D042E|nr:putative cobaltochelatase [Clostridium sp. KNHs214]